MSLALCCSFASIADDTIDTSIESASNDNSVYSSSFFDQYLPQNALEMVQRLPGFNFDQGSNARGFGGNAGNVLIDGARPTSKSGGLRSALVRIPATQVKRIEILRGGVSSGEAAGQSIVANVIRKKDTTSGSWAFKERWAPKGHAQPNLEAAISTNLGDWASSFDIDIGAGPGYRSANIETTDANDQLESAAKERLTELNEFLFINGEISNTVAGGKLTINSRIGGAHYGQEASRDIYLGRLPDDSTRDEYWDLRVNSKFKTGELGIDWTKTKENWKWRFIGLGLVSTDDFSNDFDFISLVDSDDSFDSQFFKDTNTSELIGRITYGRESGSAFKPEFGFEVTKNKLDDTTTLFSNGIQDVQNSGNVIVEELRGEIFSSFVYAASDQLTLEGGLTIETSKIKVTGDANEKQNFTYLKPRFSTTYKIDDDQQLVLELERRVGQLNFSAFSANTEISESRSTSGNSKLSPDKTTELALTYDWSFSKKGSLKLKGFYQWREDVLEHIILSPPSEQRRVHGIGNAGDAEFWGVNTDLNLPLDFILPNGLIEISYFYRNSDFDDPIINGIRVLNGHVPNRLNFTLRQDLTAQKLAWGVEYSGAFTNTSFFVNERITFHGNNRIKAFVETSQFFGVKIQLEVDKLNTGEFDRTRFIFDQDRGDSLEQTEIARRLRKPEIKLTFSKNF